MAARSNFPLIDEFAGFITPFEAADASRWKDAPSDAGNYFGLGGAGAKSISSLARDMKSFAFVGEIGQVQVSVRVGGLLILTSFKLQMEKVRVFLPPRPSHTLDH
jgi:hypothetical protein